MSQQEYNIGQILFVLSPKYNKVIPVKVTEHIISKTVEGEQSKYIVSPYFNKNKSYNLEQLAGTILFDTQEIYDFMLDRASCTIKSIIEESVENAKLLGYNENLNIVQTNNSKTSSEQESQEETSEVEFMPEDMLASTVSDVPGTIVLPDGSTAKVNIKS